MCSILAFFSYITFYHFINILRWLYNFYQSLDRFLVKVWGFTLMKKNRIQIHIFSTSYFFSMFPVRISCFNEGIFHSDVIQYVIVVDVFTYVVIYTVFSSVVVWSSPIFQTCSWTRSIWFENCSSIFSILKNLRWVYFSCAVSPSSFTGLV